MDWLEQAAGWLRDLAARQPWLAPARATIERLPDWAVLGLVVVSALLIVRLLFWRRSRPAAAVIDDDPPWARRSRAVARADRSWDAFISYKSENVEVARRVADRLIASGRRVWFAEYEILLAGRERFQEAIDAGLDRTEWGLVFTNTLYAQSEHCAHEMARLIAHCGPEKMVDVRIPADRETLGRFPELERAAAIDYADDIEALLRFIANRTGWRIVDAAPSPIHSARRLHEDICAGMPYTIDVTGWTQSRQRAGVVHQHQKYRLAWNLQAGDTFDPALYDARRRWTSTGINDRALYDEMCRYAQGYFEDTQPAQPVGVHLFFMDGASHFAVTYKSGPYWKRRYSVMLVEPTTYKAAEFVFTFQFEGPFEEYCLLTDTMDAVVRSLHWHAPAHARSAEESAPSNAPERMSRLIDDMPAANKLIDQGMALMKKGRLAEGAPVLERALEYSMVAEMRGMIHFNLGRAYERSGDMGAAVRHYEASAAANPAQANALCNLGSIRHRQGDVRGALELFLKAAAVDPGDHITANNIAVCYEDLGDMDNARSWQAKARQLRR